MGGFLPRNVFKSVFGNLFEGRGGSGLHGIMNRSDLRDIVRIDRRGNDISIRPSPEARHAARDIGRIANVADVVTGGKVLPEGRIGGSVLARDLGRDHNAGIAARERYEAEDRQRDRYENGRYRGGRHEGQDLPEYNPRHPVMQREDGSLYHDAPRVSQPPSAAAAGGAAGVAVAASTAARADMDRATAGPQNILPQNFGASSPEIHNFGDTTRRAMNEINALPENERLAAFNAMPMDRKSEVIREINTLNASLGIRPIRLDAQGNLDVQDMAHGIAEMTRPPAGGERMTNTAPQAAGLRHTENANQTMAQASATAQAGGVGRVDPSAPDVTAAGASSLPKSGEILTTKMLNELYRDNNGGAADVKTSRVGQGENQYQVFTREGKIIGGYASSQTEGKQAFLTREDLNAKFEASGKTMTGMEQAAGIANTVASLKPETVAAPAAPAVEAPKPLPSVQMV